MGFWTLSFEIMILALFILFLILMIIRKSWRALIEMISGVLFGITLEYANIYLAGNYEYNIQFFLQIGTPPNNVPIIIALAWGMIIVSVMSVSNSFQIPNHVRIFFDALFGISIDFAMDVVAIRLDGGFWTWLNVTLSNKINLEGVFGVIWGNYLGWFFVLFIFSSILRIEQKYIKNSKKVILIIVNFINPIVAYAFLILSFIIFGYLSIILGNFAIGTILLFILSFIYVSANFILRKPKIIKYEQFETIILFASFYLYFLIAFVISGIIAEIPWFLAVILVLFIASMLIEIISIKFKSE